MKLLYLTNIPSPYRVDFFNQLGTFCELTVLFERKKAKDRDIRWKVDYFENFQAIFLKGILIGTDASLCPEVICYLKKGYDAIILGGYSSPTYMLAMEYMRLRRIPFLFNADGGFVKSDSKFLYRLKKHYIGSASGWLSTGVKTDEYLIHYGARKKDIFHYSFTSVKEKELYHSREEERRQLKEKLCMTEKRIAITVGQFIPRKGFDLLIQAAGMLSKEYGVYVIGGIPHRQYLDIQEKTGATNVHFVDFMEKEKLKEYYVAADIFVFPTREDVWGLVLNEAMAFGLPCVASVKANASHELIEDEQSGYLVDPEAVEEMAVKMELLLKNDSLRCSMGEKAFERMKGFTIEKMAKQHLDIIHDWKKHREGGT